MSWPHDWEPLDAQNSNEPLRPAPEYADLESFEIPVANDGANCATGKVVMNPGKSPEPLPQ
jgi:hypothetical protein